MSRLTIAPVLPVRVGPCDVGQGVFAARDFAPGEPILRFAGPPLTLAEALALGDRHGNTLQVGRRSYLDLQPPGVLVNHSCDPNAGVVDDVVLAAVRPIRRGEEVRWDYSTTMADGTWTMRCACGSGECRGEVRDFRRLPGRVRDRYLRLGVVQRFIAREFGRVPERRGGVMLLVNASAGPSRIHGNGLFAREFIPAGTKIWEFRPGFDVLLTAAAIRRMPPAARRQAVYWSYFHRATKCFVMSSDDDRFTNHSDAPNTRVADGCTWAVRDIYPGEEITNDYRELARLDHAAEPGAKAG